MKLHSFVLLVLACVPSFFNLAHAAPLENDLTIDCNGKRTIGVGLCADINFGGYCHDFLHCESSCYDLIDYGAKDAFGSGVSSFVMPKGQACEFFAGRNCDHSSDNAGSYESQPDMAVFRNGGGTDNVHMNDKTNSWVCFYGSKNKRDDSTPELTETSDILNTHQAAEPVVDPTSVTEDNNFALDPVKRAESVAADATGIRLCENKD
jgi:hypothetical protein